MRRKKSFKHGQTFSLLVAGSLGYAIGGWTAAATRSADFSAAQLSAAQVVALRFPQDSNGTQDSNDASRIAALSNVAPRADITATTNATATVIGNAQLALFSPEPMVLPPPAQSAASPPVADAAAMDTASSASRAAQQEATAEAPALLNAVSPPRATAEARQHAAALVAHHANRPGFVLNDAQIASIKARLNLTPDQEQMWPAVEAALRNLAYTSEREARRHSAHANPSQVAAVDPQSAEVQNLKSAAIPLLMSFNSEQKDEVRNLAHVMGLDQLASQF